RVEEFKMHRVWSDKVRKCGESIPGRGESTGKRRKAWKITVYRGVGGRAEKGGNAGFVEPKVSKYEILRGENKEAGTVD
ncbi:hypothetical protein MK528_11455, partial [Streptococcus gordonii]|nr:hypothetical protein [Streptococcus gordonii]